MPVCKWCVTINTKKKELLGNFYPEGVTDAVDPTSVNDHDFPSSSEGKVIPHGIYDLQKNKASLHLNTSHDTTEFACESMAILWEEQAEPDYPLADEILVLCDGGGRKGYRMLRRLGIDRWLAWNTAKSAHGPWRLSGSPALRYALPNRYFKNLGLPELAAR